ncbi:hypothetical protein ES703_44427 [subsurface metagenome]
MGIDEELTVESILAGSRVAGKCYAGSGIFAHITEDHRLNIYCGAPVIRDALNLAIGHRSSAVPRAKYGGNRTPELVVDIIGKILLEYLFNLFLKDADQLFKVTGIQISIKLGSLSILHLMHLSLELLSNALTFLRLDACRLFHNHIAVHHN